MRQLVLGSYKNAGCSCIDNGIGSPGPDSALDAGLTTGGEGGTPKSPGH